MAPAKKPAEADNPPTATEEPHMDAHKSGEEFIEAQNQAVDTVVYSGGATGTEKNTGNDEKALESTDIESGRDQERPEPDPSNPETIKGFVDEASLPRRRDGSIDLDAASDNTPNPQGNRYPPSKSSIVAARNDAAERRALAEADIAAIDVEISELDAKINEES